MKGPLGKFIDIYGNKKQKKVYKLLQPEEFKPKEVKKPKLKLPDSFTTFKESSLVYPVRKQAHNYLKNRGITDEIIEKYDIGYTVSGEYSYRIIIPSYDMEDRLNYFVGRAWVPKKMKYKNPSVPKDEIIFNESRINWEENVYLCEGVFDAFFLPNPIPMLGKMLSTKLFENLYEKVQGDIHICLDGDAWDNALRLYHNLNGGR
jgi:DNA primase